MNLAPIIRVGLNSMAVTVYLELELHLPLEAVVQGVPQSHPVALPPLLVFHPVGCPWLVRRVPQLDFTDVHPRKLSHHNMELVVQELLPNIQITLKVSLLEGP
jgi:hypothetical protein